VQVTQKEKFRGGQEKPKTGRGRSPLAVWAKRDFKYLLDRNYRKESALNFVSDHYRLNKAQRNGLFRSVFSEKEIKNHKSKLMPIWKISEKNIVIDGFNVLITVESILSGKRVIRCTDGFLRDVSGVYGKYRMSEKTKFAIEKILLILKKYKPRYVLFIFDSQISRSGELSALIKKELHKFGLDGDAKTSKNTDSEIKKLNWITLTSDTTIIEKVNKVIDIAKKLI